MTVPILHVKTMRAQVRTPRSSDGSLLSHEDSIQVHGLEELAEGQKDRGTETVGDAAGGAPWKGPRPGPKMTCPLQAAGEEAKPTTPPGTEAFF